MRYSTCELSSLTAGQEAAWSTAKMEKVACVVLGEVVEATLEQIVRTLSVVRVASLGIQIAEMQNLV